MVMIRRTFIAACATAALATAAGTAVAAPKEVKMGYALAVNSHYGAAAKAWTESVERPPVAPLPSSSFLPARWAVSAS